MRDTLSERMRDERDKSRMEYYARLIDGDEKLDRDVQHVVYPQYQDTVDSHIWSGVFWGLFVTLCIIQGVLWASGWQHFIWQPVWRWLVR